MAAFQASRAVLIAGPTASGKSALALRLARETGGVIVNADSMQVYRDLRVLTARPSVAEEAEIPHRLYGHVDAAVNYSAGAYVVDATRLLAELREEGRMAILVGGTGLYFKALTRGLSAVPPVPDDVRDGVRRRLAAEGPEALHIALAACDPEMAARLAPKDRTRVARALEVIEATGKSLRDWQRQASEPLLPPGTFDAIFLAPDRDELYARIDARLIAMMEQGALDEVAALGARDLDPLLPAMKAHGVPALIKYLNGDITRNEAIAIGQADTRHYAKRQFTWFRHQLREFTWIAPREAVAWQPRRSAG